MNNSKVYTLQEANEIVKNLKEVFPIVRILKEQDVHGNTALDSNSHYCFNIWGEKIPCENCISAKTLKDHQDRTKIEYAFDKPFQVYSIYINIDGTNNVIEILKEIDQLSIDPDDVRLLSTQLLHLNDEIYRDTLTGTYNRAYYDDKKHKINTQCSGIAFLDIDDFKNINDIYGHHFGDEVLKEVASIELNNVRREDIVIRIGGDEFLYVAPNITKQAFHAKMETIRQQIATFVFHEHNKLRVTVSIGLDIIDKASMTLEDATMKVDQLMLAAKKNKNFVMSSWMDQETNFDLISEEQKLFVLIVDDSQINRDILAYMLEDKYRILTANDGVEALQLVLEYKENISLILLDIEMPNMGGFEFLNELRLEGFIDSIPVMMISAADEPDVIVHAFDLGASDFIAKPFNSRILKQRVENIIKLFMRQRQFKNEIRRQIDRTHSVSKMTTIILSHIIGYRNHETEPHLMHVEQITNILLESLSKKDVAYHFSYEDINNIVAASGMHDIGKLGVPEYILNKPGRFTDEEYTIMKTHTTIGAEMLDSLTQYQDEPLVRYAHDIVRWHHERFDGKGYPDGLVGNDIPIEAQVVSVADVYDALVSERVYKNEYSQEEALQMILNGECGAFNPLLLECLKESFEKIKVLY